MNLHVPVSPGVVSPTDHCAICEASSAEIVPSLVTSAAVCWLAVSVMSCTEYCATVDASRADIAAVVASPVFDGVSVYAPEPKPVRLNTPFEPLEPETFCAPAADKVTPGTASGLAPK